MKSFHIQDITSTTTYLACLVPSHQNVPGCQVSVYKGLPCQVHHAWGYFLTEPKKNFEGTNSPKLLNMKVGAAYKLLVDFKFTH